MTYPLLAFVRCMQDVGSQVTMQEVPAPVSECLPDAIIRGDTASVCRGYGAVGEILHGGIIECSVDIPGYVHVTEYVERVTRRFAGCRFPVGAEDWATELVGLCVEPSQMLTAL